jgi:CheY-like chemotaxis protein
MNKKILILDDSEIVTEMTAFLMEKEGYSTIKFTEGKDVLEYIENTENTFPNLIIADHSLTTKGGVRKTAFKILSKLKSFGVDIPVIMASGNCNKSVIDKYMELGIKSYICKDEMDYIDILIRETKNILEKN